MSAHIQSRMSSQFLSLMPIYSYGKNWYDAIPTDISIDLGYIYRRSIHLDEKRAFPVLILELEISQKSFQPKNNMKNISG